MAQLGENPLAMRETWVRSLGWEYPLEKGKATSSSILAWRIPWTQDLVGYSPCGCDSGTPKRLHMHILRGICQCYSLWYKMCILYTHC